MEGIARPAFPSEADSKASPAKRELRRQCRRRRGAVDDETRQRAGRRDWGALLEYIAALRVPQPRQEMLKIAVYIGISDEFPTDGLVSILQGWNCRIFAPVVEPSSRTMSFCSLGDPDDLVQGPVAGIRQPKDCRSAIDATDLDVVLLPLLGFTASGHRLGQGGGYYDRALRECRQGARRSPKLVGLAFTAQRCEHIPVQEHDVILDAICTEEGLTEFGAAQDTVARAPGVAAGTA